MKRLNSKKGFISIESLAPITAILAFMLLGMGIYFYITPKTMMAEEVQILATTAKIQGGLTTPATEANGLDDVTMFKKKMKDMGYDDTKVKVTAIAQPGNINALGVPSLKSNATTGYIKREDKMKIDITVEAPAKKTVLGTAFYLVGINDNLSDTYVVKKTVMSERY